MAIFKVDGFVVDDWRFLAPAEELPPDGKIILTLPQWLAVRALALKDRPLGLLLEPGEVLKPGHDLQAIASDFSLFALIVVAFPNSRTGAVIRSPVSFAGPINIRASSGRAARSCSTSCNCWPAAASIVSRSRMR